MKAAVSKYKNRLIWGLSVIFILFCWWALRGHLAAGLEALIEHRLGFLLDSQVDIEQVRLELLPPCPRLKLLGTKLYYKQVLQVCIGEINLSYDLTDLADITFSGIFTDAEVAFPSNLPRLTDLCGSLQITKESLSLHFIRAKWGDVSLKGRGWISLGSRHDFDFTFLPPEGKVHINGRYDASQIEVITRLRHLRIYGTDVVCDLNLRVASLNEGPNRLFEGQLNSNYTILDHHPFSEFNSRFVIDLTNRVLWLKKLIIAGYYHLQGEIELWPPFTVDLNIDIKNAPMDDIFLLSSQRPDWRLGERFSGTIKLKGPFLKPFCQGKLTAGKGVFKGEVPYDSIEVNFEGTYPLLELANSWIYRKEGSIALVGVIDFTQKNLFKEIKLISDGNIVWRGWDIRREPYSDLIEMNKDIGNEMKIGFKAYLEDETHYEKEGKSEIELEFKLKEHQSLKMRMREDEELWGFEHKITF